MNADENRMFYLRLSAFICGYFDSFTATKPGFLRLAGIWVSRPTFMLRARVGRRERGLLQAHDDGGGGDVEAIDAVAEIEGAGDGGIGVEGDEEVADEEIERAAVDREAGDLDAFDIDGGAAGGGAYASGDADGARAIDELGDEPAGLMAGGAFELAEIDDGGAGGEVASGDAHLGIAHSGGDFVGGPGAEFGAGERNARAVGQAVRIDGGEFALGASEIAGGRGGQREGGEQEREGPGPADHGGLDGFRGKTVASGSAKRRTGCGRILRRRRGGAAGWIGDRV